MKKLLALTMAVIMIAAMTACGGSSSPTAEGGEGAAATGDEPSLKFWYWDNSMEEQYKLMFADFESKNPGMKVEYSITPWADYWTKIQTALPTGEGPDVMWLNHPNAVTYIPSGNLMAFDDLDLDMSHFSDNLYAPYTKEDKLYGVPIFFDTVAMFYNKALFDEAGVPYPERGWTWDDMRDKALKLTKTEGDEITQYGLAFPSDNQGGTANFVMQNGGHIFTDDHMALDMNNPKAMEALQFMQDLMMKDKVAPTVTEFMQMNNQGELFINEMIAMEIGGLWRVQTYHEALGDKLAIVHMPKKEKEACTFHNLAYVASAKTKSPETTKAFIKYTTTKEAGDFVAPVFLPAYNESQDAWFATYPDLDLKVFAEAVDYAFPLQIAAKNAGTAFSAFENEIQKIFTNETITEDALKQMDDAVNAEINK